MKSLIQFRLIKLWKKIGYDELFLHPSYTELYFHKNLNKIELQKDSNPCPFRLVPKTSAFDLSATLKSRYGTLSLVRARHLVS